MGPAGTGDNADIRPCCPLDAGRDGGRQAPARPASARLLCLPAPPNLRPTPQPWPAFTPWGPAPSSWGLGPACDPLPKCPPPLSHLSLHQTMENLRHIQKWTKPYQNPVFPLPQFNSMNTQPLAFYLSPINSLTLITLKQIPSTISFHPQTFRDVSVRILKKKKKKKKTNTIIIPKMVKGLP